MKSSIETISLLEKHKKALENHIKFRYSMIPTHEIEDAFQELALFLLTNEDLHGKEVPLTWLKRYISRILVKMHRNKKPKFEIPWSESVKDIAEELHEETTLTLTIKRLKEETKKLPYLQRKIIELISEKPIQIRDVAKKLKITKETAYERLYRAKNSLRFSLKKIFTEETIG
jgi:RNA polymerase sigma factor (sigma-70 family)